MVSVVLYCSNVININCLTQLEDPFRRFFFGLAGWCVWYTSIHIKSQAVYFALKLLHSDSPRVADSLYCQSLSLAMNKTTVFYSESQFSAGAFTFIAWSNHQNKSCFSTTQTKQKQEENLLLLCVLDLTSLSFPALRFQLCVVHFTDLQK